MALTDSKAAFKQRLIQVIPHVPTHNAAIAGGIETFSALAFSVGTPQAPASDDALRTFADNLVPAGYGMSSYSGLRQLHFEATTLAVAQLKAKVTGDSEDGKHKSPVIEKQARLADQRTRLVGIEIKGELQPSFALVDAANNMIESNSVMWIAPSKCTSRDQEIQQGSKNMPSVVHLEQQTLKLSAQWCLQRRALALGQERPSSWSMQSKWINQTLTILNAPPPPGHGKITLDQLVKADKQLWALLSQEYDVAVAAAAPAANMPFDGIVDGRLHSDPRVTMHLLPLPSFVKEVKSTPAEPSSKSAVTKKAKVEEQARGFGWHGNNHG